VIVLTAVLVFSTFLPALAQHRTDDDVAACAACGGVTIFLAIVFIIHIAILIWVARDAKARGMSSPVGWLILIFFTGVVGLIIFILSRPKGPLTPCPHCGNKKLQAMVKCPHCGN
jgi:cytochrome bd-type quinol oxidase subunit 2